MPQQKKRLGLAPRTKDVLWQSGKAVICLVQLYLLAIVGERTIEEIRQTLLEGQGAIYPALLLALEILFFVALWWYYDRIDDRGFDRFCATENPPSLLHDPAWRLGIVLSVAGATPVFARSLVLILRFFIPGVSSAVWVALACLLAAGGATLGCILRVRKLNYAWSVQKKMRRHEAKRVKPAVRVVYAVIYYVSLWLATVAGTVLVPAVIGVALILIYLLRSLVVTVAVCLVAWWCIHKIRRIHQRRDFLRRLSRLAKAGEVTYTIHGHPYRALFFKRVPFGLTVTDLRLAPPREETPTASGWNRREKPATERTYQVAVADCGHRRFTVVLADNYVYRFMYSFRIRAIGTMGMGRSDIMTIPLGVWFKNNMFQFPEGEGERILLVDPAPARLCMHGFREGELLPLDNGSRVYDYTTYGRLAFLRLVERT